MPKLITNVEESQVSVVEMRVQIAQIAARLDPRQIVNFSFRLTVEDYKPRGDAKSRVSTKG